MKTTEFVADCNIIYIVEKEKIELLRSNGLTVIKINEL